MAVDPGGHVPEPGAGVGDGDHRQPGGRGAVVPGGIGEHGRGPGPGRLFGELGAVDALSLQRHVQVSGAYRAGVVRDAGDGDGVDVRTCSDRSGFGGRRGAQRGLGGVDTRNEGVRSQQRDEFGERTWLDVFGSHVRVTPREVIGSPLVEVDFSARRRGPVRFGLRPAPSRVVAWLAPRRGRRCRASADVRKHRVPRGAVASLI